MKLQITFSCFFIHFLFLFFIVSKYNRKTHQFRLIHIHGRENHIAKLKGTAMLDPLLDFHLGMTSVGMNKRHTKSSHNVPLLPQSEIEFWVKTEITTILPFQIQMWGMDDMARPHENKDTYPSLLRLWKLLLTMIKNIEQNMNPSLGIL